MHDRIVQIGVSWWRRPCSLMGALLDDDDDDDDISELSYTMFEKWFNSRNCSPIKGP